MTIEKALDFLDQWISENINADAYPPDDTEAKRLAKACLHAAQEQGLTQALLEEAVGDNLVSYIFQAQKDATNAEVDRLAAKDK